MTTDEILLRLLRNGETIEVEFKRDVNDAELVEAVVCLANSRGGWLLLGVDDDGSVVGAAPRHGATTDPPRLTSLIQSRTVPQVPVDVSNMSVGGKDVVVVEVPRIERPVATSRGQFFRRGLGADGKPRCVPFFYHEMLGREASLNRLDVTATPVIGARWEDLDPLEFRRARRMIEQQRGDTALASLSDEELARALGAVMESGGNTVITMAGLLLFGREARLQQLLPTHEAAFQVLRGTAVEVNDFFRLPLLALSEELFSRFQARHREDELLVGMLRIAIPDFEPRASREAIHNALIHRDYTLLGASYIQWLDDRIEISNPGGFVEGVRLDNLLVTPPRPRNPLIADAFKRLGVVERTGRGIDAIFEGCLRYGRPAPDYGQSTETSVKAILPGGVAHLGFSRLLVEQSNRLGQPLRVGELLVLYEAWRERRIDSVRAAELVQRPITEARALLERLVEAGLLESRGERWGRFYHLSAAIYRALGEPAAYVRQRGFEPLQQEQMVLQYLRAHGRITRREAAELCRLGDDQAFRLLKRVVKERKIEQHGVGKGTRYGLRA